MVWMLAISGKLKKHYICSDNITQKIFDGVCYKRPGGEFDFKGKFRRSDIGRLYLRLDDEVVQMAREGAKYKEVLCAQRERNSSVSKTSNDKEDGVKQFQLADYV